MIGRLFQRRAWPARLSRADLTIEEAAAALDISVRTANRHFAFAKAWLFRELAARCSRVVSPRERRRAESRQRSG